jgi:putative two-component system response regulator
MRIAQEQNPSLIILDVIMPGIKGRDVCKRLKAEPKTASIPVVFLTAKDSPDDIAAEVSAGAETHLTKPINPKLLIATVAGLLENS